MGILKLDSKAFGIPASARFARCLSPEVSKFVLPVAIYLDKLFLPQFPIKLNH